VLDIGCGLGAQRAKSLRDMADCERRRSHA
jgi:hypothetical protein